MPRRNRMPFCEIVAAMCIVLLSAATNDAVGQVLPGEGEGDGCADCVVCYENGEQGHEDIANASGSYTNPGHPCFGGVSCLGHLSCGGALGDPVSGDLRLAMARAGTGSLREVLQLVAAFPHRARVNSERGALQVSGCRPDVIVAHLPLSKPDLALVRQQQLPAYLALARQRPLSMLD